MHIFGDYVHLNLLTNLTFNFHKKVLYYSVFNLVYLVCMWALACDMCILGDMANSSRYTCKLNVFCESALDVLICMFLLVARANLEVCINWIMCEKLYLCVFVHICVKYFMCNCVFGCIYAYVYVPMCVFDYNLKGREYTLQMRIWT